ncbi:MAG: YdeI/OmpD-associated family protein [Rhodoferax sp.]|nr:YdeI/OmpD-associated family protein [Rhodoferax sp.]
MATEQPIILFETPAAWATWLEAPTAPAGLWLKMAKGSTGIASITYAEALEVALCFGWIDSQKKSIDAQFWMQKFTPRRPGSIWSKINCQKIEALIARGAMKPAGLREVETAKHDGRWEAAYDSQSGSVLPADFQAALHQNPDALAFFATLKSAERYSFLFRIQTAKKAETRARNIQKFVSMLAAGEKIRA